MPFSGQKLRALRLAQGLTQAELAHRAHVRERQIIRWENGQNAPRIGAIRSLARVLKTSLDSLMADDETSGEETDEEADLVADLVSALLAVMRKFADEAALRSVAGEGRRAG